MNHPFVPLGRPSLGKKEIEKIWETFESGWVSKGPKAAEFELMIENLLSVNHAIAVTNCTSALHLALMALDIKNEDRVIVSDYTFPATGFAPRYVGADLVLCDVDPLTYNMNPDRLEQILKWHSYRIKAIIVVHTFGQMAPMDKIMDLARKYDVRVIEDAACALGASYMGKQAGTWGDIGCFSLHARKGITTGEGGIVTTNNDRWASKIRKLSEFGVLSTWTREQSFFQLPSFETLGFNYKMSDITAAVGIAQLGKLKRIIEIKRKLAEKYTFEILSRIPFLEPPYLDPQGEHIFQSYVTLVKPEFKKMRDQIIMQFWENQVQVNIGTYALHRQPYFRIGKQLVQSGDVFDRAISLPIYPGVNINRVLKVGEKIWQELKNCLPKQLEKSTSHQSNGGFCGIEEIRERSLSLRGDKSSNTPN